MGVFTKGVLVIPVVNLLFPDAETTSATEERAEAEPPPPDPREDLGKRVAAGLAEKVSPELADKLRAESSLREALVELFTQKAQVAGYTPLQVILLVCALAMVVAIVGACARFAEVSLSYYLRSRIVIDIRTRLYDRICRLPVSFFDKERSGDLISRLTNDLATTHRAAEYVFGDFIEQPIRISVGVAILLILSWKLTFMVGVFGLFIVLPIVKIGQRIRRTARKRQEKHADLTDQMTQTLSGIRVVKVFSMEEAESARFLDENLVFLKREMKVVRGKALSRSSMELYAGVSVPLLLLAAFWLITNKQADKAVLTGYMVSVGMLYQPLKLLSRAYTVLQDSAAGMERVFSILNREPAVEDRSGAVALTGLRQGIVFRDVCFSYDGVTPILRNVSFEAKAGEMVAIVGPSGAGKTTLLDLLVRFYEPKSGEILLDGRDIREIKRSSLLEHIAMVTQDPFLFNVSIRENILYGRPTATLEELEDAARAAHVEEFIRYIPDGYEARVGERGVLLSGGQKQRITIARALLRNAPILILDEATSNLDSESERLIQEALPRLVKGRTTFVIAHRLSTVRAADRIVVMNEGSVAETGTHDELLSRSGLYRHLHELQFSA
jgi:subfamily B ATP-binding cassette protein MsbA